MRVLQTKADLQDHLQPGCVIVPTMGALHRGHGVLIEQAVAYATDMASRSDFGLGGVLAPRSRFGLGKTEKGDKGTGVGQAGRLPVVVSVFVNPTQFNESTDFSRYPRVLDEDCQLCAQLGVDAVFAPDPEVVYPPDEDIPVGPIPAVATEPGLEDAYRPGHFAGVCQVVRRLFVLCRAGAAVFGEKDWQQLQVVRAMVEHEGLGVAIIPAATVREADGLAMSSRNRLLGGDGGDGGRGGEDRSAALAISKALGLAGKESEPDKAEAIMKRVLREAGHGRIEPEYAAVRDAQTLGPVRANHPARALIAARVGTQGNSVRLIDNAPWPADGVCLS